MKRQVLISLTVIALWVHALPIFFPGNDSPAPSSPVPAPYSLFPMAYAATEDPYRLQRAGMVSEIEEDLKLTSGRVGKKALSQCVLDALLNVLRHEFVPEHLKRNAYENRPLPIGYGQTISQPYIVGIMTELLDVNKESLVLEVGTGSGYQAAILAHCVKQVYTMEIIGELGEEAKPRLQRLGYQNIEVRIGDGYYGWKEHAPFDAIIVTAAANNIPPPLIEQLKPGAKMVIPVGSPFMTQYLMLVEKGDDGKITTKQLLPVAFVPLTGGH
jgi:protein-L-isoaspartate(D-aspartate) O-methyltransferase